MIDGLYYHQKSNQLFILRNRILNGKTMTLELTFTCSRKFKGKLTEKDYEFIVFIGML